MNEADRDTRLAQFQRSKLLFDRIISEGVHSADLYADAGNAALQSEELGQAVLAYRRALRIDPDHPRATQNLQHTRSLLPAWVPRPQPSSAMDTFFFWHRSLALGERNTLAALFFAFGVGMYAAAYRWRKTLLRNGAILCGIVWLGLLGSVVFEPDRGNREGVIVTRGGEPALSADAPGARPVFSNPLPAGTEARIVERRGDWTRIQLADASRTAWIRSGSIDTIGF